MISHGDSLFDQTHALATRSLRDHPIDNFGAHRIRDPHQGIVLDSGGRQTQTRALNDLAKRQHDFGKQQALQRQNNIGLAKALARSAHLVAEAKAKKDTTAHPNPSLKPPTPILRPSTKGPYVITKKSDPIEDIHRRLPELSTINDFLKYRVGYGIQTQAALGQVILVEGYGVLRSPNARVASRVLPGAASTYRILGKAGALAGKLSTPATILSVYVDANDYKMGKTSTARFGYKMMGTGTGVYVGAAIGEVGGVHGILLGSGIGIAFDGLEWMYDTFVDPAFQQISEHVRYFNEAVRNGWMPGM